MREVELYCGSTFSDERGTSVVKKLPEWLEEPLVTGVAIADQTEVSVNGLPEDVELYTKICNEFAARHINLDMISLVLGAGKASVTFSVTKGDLTGVKPALDAALSGVDGWFFDLEKVAKVSAEGVGMQSASGVAGRFFGALAKSGVTVLASSTSEIKIAVLVPRTQGKAAVNALMDEFELKE